MIEPPHIGYDEDGNVTLEWWCGSRKITMYPTDKVLLKVWGPNMDTEMEEVYLAEDGAHRACNAAFQWLVAK